MAGESVVPQFTGAPESRPGVAPAGAPVQNLYLGQGGFYLSPTARSSDDYRIVENGPAAEAAIREGDLPLVIPARGLAHSPTPQELDAYLRAQYETPDAPFGDLARQRSGYRGTPPQVDPRYDESDAPMRKDPEGSVLRQNVSDAWSGAGTLTRGPAPTLAPQGFPMDRARVVSGPAAPQPGTSLAPDRERLQPVAPLPGTAAAPNAEPVPPAAPQLIPLAEYLQQKRQQVYP